MTKLIKSEIIAIAVVAAVYLLIILASPQGFWVIDEGNKYIWAQNFAETGSLMLEDIAAEVSPGHSAFRRPFSVTVDDGSRQVSTFSPLFLIIDAPFAAWGGLKLALMIPLLAGLGLILAARRLALNLGLPFNFCTILLLGLCSPLLFYSLTLWEHGLAVLIGLAALNTALSAGDSAMRRILAGVMFALAVYIRPETAVFALGAWIFLIRGRGSVLIGGLVGVAALAGINWILTGSLIPLQIAANYAWKWGDISLAELLTSRIESFYALLLEGSRLWYLAALLIASAGAYFFLPGVIKFAFPLTSIVLVVVSFFDSTPFFNLIHRNSLLYCAPLFFVVIAFKPESERGVSFKRLIIFTALLTPLIAPVFGGIHFGPRLLLAIVPLLGIASTAYIRQESESGSVFRADAVYALILAQVLVTIWGVSLLQGRRKANFDRTQALLEKSKNSIVTRQWWLQQEMPELYQKRDFYLVDTSVELKKMLIDYYIGGVRFFTLLFHDRREAGSTEAELEVVKELRGAEYLTLKRILDDHDAKLLEMFNNAPPKQTSHFTVKTPYPSMNLIGIQYAIGFDVKGAAKLSDELGVYLGQLDKLPESEKYLRYAAKWDSRVGKYHYNLAYNLGKQGRYSEALQELEIAHEKDPESEVIRRMLKELKEKIDREVER